MTEPATVPTPRLGPTPPRWLARVPTVLFGAGFLVAAFLVAVLPALAVAYAVVGFPVRDVVVVLGLWAASAALTVTLFLAISRTFVRILDGSRAHAPSRGPSED